MTKYKVRSNVCIPLRRMLLYVIIMIAIWFFTPISDFYNHKILKHLFNHNLGHGKCILVIIVLFVFLVEPLFLNLKKVINNRYLVSPVLLSPIIAFLTLYFYYRFFSNEYLFYSLFEASKIKFLDLPLLVLLVYVIIMLFNTLLEKGNGDEISSPLLVDAPLKDIGSDEFNRKKYYDLIIKVISDSIGEEGKALSIGIVNKWGEGKTSFIEFLKKNVQKEDPSTIFIEFNAWYSSNSINLTFDFFETLDKALSKYIYTGTVIRNYAKSLTNINDKLKLLKYLPGSWTGERSNKEYFEYINKLLSNLNRPIIVAIDDLDRLDNREVYAVFQVIRNSANFDKIVFITAFDKEYTIHALSELKIHNPQDYIKKMFDVEFSIPVISKLNLTKLFYNAITSIISSLSGINDVEKNELRMQIENIFYSNVKYESSIFVKYSIVNRMLFRYLKNKRDVIRFVNSFKVTLRDSYDVLYLPDVFILELIKFLDLNVYFELFKTQNYFTIEFDDNGIRKNKLFLGDEKTSHKRDELFEISKKLKNDDLGKDLNCLIKKLFAEPLQNDFNYRFSFYYNRNYLTYHQFYFSGVWEEDVDALLDRK